MIFIIVTTCINNKFYAENKTERQKRYIECISFLIELLKNYQKIKLIIVENNGKRSTFLDNFQCDVLYTNNNSKKLKHKAGNELLDIKEAIDKYSIRDDDFIVKITGRYKLLNLDFIKTVINKNLYYDVFIRYINLDEPLVPKENKKKYYVLSNNYSTNDDCILGLFAIKCKYLKNFEYRYNCLSPEKEFAKYVNENINKIFNVSKLNLECCFAENNSFLLLV